MRLLPSLPSVLLAVSSGVLLGARAQDAASFTDPETGIVFSQYSAPTTGRLPRGGFQLGLAFPQNLDKNEYIGHLVASRPEGKGWVAISHAATMLNSLILVAWVQGREVQTSFRYATNYTQPDIYIGPLSFSQLAHTVNKTHFTITYRCQGCFSWNYHGQAATISLQSEAVLFGWGQGTHDPISPNNVNSPIDYHDNGFGVIAAIPGLAANPKYDSWANRNQPPKNLGPPKVSSLDPKLAGNRTAWPTFSKQSSGPPPTYTPGQVSVNPGRPAKPTGGAPAIGGAVPPPNAPAPTQAPAPPVNSASAWSTGRTTITGSWEDDEITTTRPRILDVKPTAKAPPPSCPSPDSVPMPEDDLGPFPAVSGVPKRPPGAGAHGTMNELPSPVGLPHRKRQVQGQNTASPCLPQILSPPATPTISGMTLDPPRLPIPTSSGSGSSTSVAQIPRPQDDLGAFPAVEGVPKKPPMARVFWSEWKDVDAGKEAKEKARQ